MSLRSLNLEKMLDCGQQRANSEGAPMAVVVHQGLVFVCPRACAQLLCEQYPKVRIIAELTPEITS